MNLPAPKIIWSFVGALVVCGGLFVGGWKMDDRYDTRYAHAEETVKTMQQLTRAIKTTNKRIDQHFIEERMEYVQKKMDKIEDRCGTCEVAHMPQPDRDNYRELVREKEVLEKKLDALMKEE